MSNAKPGGLQPQYGAQFQDSSIVAAYKHRPPYPAETFPILADLLPAGPGPILDVGCGRGELARYMLPFATRIDAVDQSAGMIAEGQQLPGGDNPNLRWICAPIEQADLQGPYSLITAGASLHWMDWHLVMPRFARLLALGAVLAIVNNTEPAYPWSARRGQIITRYSTNRDFQPYDLVAELEQRSLFDKQGEQKTRPLSFSQSVADYIESHHSMNGFSRDRMTTANAAAFDREMRDLLEPFVTDGKLELQLIAEIVWGKPLAQ